MIVFKHKGNFNKTYRLLNGVKKLDYKKILDSYAQEGVRALSQATPIDTGYTRDSWDYEIEATKNAYVISWTNSNVVDGVPVAIVLQYGHATRNGGFVEGIDYINPALKPLFDKIADAAWWEVTNL